jgi:hypothetical protein
MSSKTHHSDPMPPMQEVDLNDASWNDVVSQRLPVDLEAQARQLQAWTRQRGLRCISDLLRALSVYACASTPSGNWACGQCSKGSARFLSGRGANGSTARGSRLSGSWASC